MTKPKRAAVSERGVGKPPRPARAAGEKSTRTEEARSWLPGDYLTGRQVALIVICLAFIIAASVDAYRQATFDPKAQEQAYLAAIYRLADKLPSSVTDATAASAGPRFTEPKQLEIAAEAAAEAADVLDELDSEQYPHVASTCAVVLADVLGALNSFALRTHEGAVQATKLAMALADLALQADADKEHIAALLLASRATRIIIEEHTVPSDEDLPKLRLRAAAFVEQALAVQSENPDLRVMYSAALLDARRFAEAQLQAERVLAKYPEYSVVRRNVAEWLAAAAAEHSGAASEVGAATTLQTLRRLITDGAMPVTVWPGHVVARLAEQQTLDAFMHA